MMACTASNSTFAVQLETDSGVFQQSSPLSLRQQPSSSPPAPPLPNTLQTHNYNFSGTVYDESTSGADSEDLLDDGKQGDYIVETDRRVFSGCSSISSFPASISQHLPGSRDQYGSPRTSSRTDSVGRFPSERAGGFDHPAASPRSLKDYASPFRHPSSVRALQMKDEVMSEANSVLRHHRRSGSQMSSYSQRSCYSSHTSPTKRSSRSHRSSPLKSGSSLKKEFPLVLLHCTLLPPNLRLRSTNIDNSLVIELLPAEYKQRWIALRDKLADVEISSRGVLISHPREDYDLLEERLLESLELRTPRIKHSHYFQSGGNGMDSGFESGSLTDGDVDHDGPYDAKCPDCGCHLTPEEVNRRWEVKVFAANGLMRTGAWAAAWQEMEKVDVEINVWLPEETRKEVEAKLAILESEPVEVCHPYSGDTWVESESMSPREREVYGGSGRLERYENAPVFEDEPPPQPELSASTSLPDCLKHDMQAQVTRYAREFVQDRRNLLVCVLSFLVLLFAFAGTPKPGIEVGAAPATHTATQSTQVVTTTITATSVATSTETVMPSVAKESFQTSLSSVRTNVIDPVSVQSLVEQISDANPFALHEGLISEKTDTARVPQPEVTIV